MLRHTENYYHFPKYSSTTLERWTKRDLISYIVCLLINYENIDASLCYQYELVKALQKVSPEFDVNKFAKTYWDEVEK